MRSGRPNWPGRILALLAVALILKIVLVVFANYGDYFGPNFQSDFLRGREGHFFGPYRWAFTAHITSGPAALLLGLFLIVERTRARFPKWHRYVGRLQVACVLLLVAPSGLAMSYHAAAGPVASASLATLAIATAATAALGARSAIRRRFAAHRRWMGRCYVLLCSAVVLRVIGGAGTVAGVSAPWFDPLATWVSWLAPLAAFELRARAHQNPANLSSPPAIEISARRTSAGVVDLRKCTEPSTEPAFMPPE